MPLREQIEAIAARAGSDFSADDRAAFEELKSALNRGILLTPFHNMALMCPATTEEQVGLHTEAFSAAVAELAA